MTMHFAPHARPRRRVGAYLREIPNAFAHSSAEIVKAFSFVWRCLVPFAHRTGLCEINADGVKYGFRNKS
jgi:hypothetical protein